MFGLQADDLRFRYQYFHHFILKLLSRSIPLTMGAI